MFNMPGIIIIDNEENELSKMQDAFFKAGFPCLPIKYENNDPENVTGIDHITIPEFLEPRIIVSDLNLKDLQNLDARTLCGPVANIIKKIIKSGPYILWIWSKHEREPAEVVTLLEERYKNQITLPLHWVRINKNEFLYGDDKKEEGLKEKILDLINQNSVFHALWDWEGRISLAAKKAVSTLHELTKPLADDYSITNHNENLKRTLAKIGNEAVGHKNALEFPGIAMDLGLAPVLADQLLSISDETQDNLWKNAIPDIGKRVEINSEIKSKLNSFYHIDCVDDTFPKGHRGTFININAEYLTANMQKFEARIGLPIKTILYEEFISSQKGNNETREAVRNSITLGFLEVSAECDHAQRKTKLHKYILAALIPEEHHEYTMFGEVENQRDKSHEGIYRLPTVWLDQKKYIIKLSFKYQIGTKPNDNKWLGQPIFRMRDQVMNDISFKCAQYSSRPGIIRFD